MLNCDLLIIDYPGSTLNIAMAMGVPTICYWSPDVWPLTDNAKSYFNALREAEILFSTPKAAAAKVNEVHKKAQAWWSTPIVKEARLDWANQFALAKRTWWVDWLRIISRV